jgi:2-succinyl-6-hydroxy-2,4-cyclohexadiene-1-carboxylate synthase
VTRIPLGGVSLNVVCRGAGPALVLLHGFTGSTETWTPHMEALSASYATIGIDMLGHGGSDAPADPARYRIERAASDILDVLDRLGAERAAILGYSMGGRVALQLSAAAPDRVAALIVESGSPGVADPAARRVRAEQDAALADAIERDGVPAFVDRWERQPLFATQSTLPRETRARLRAQRLAQPARGLANSLRGLGQGTQPSLWERLPDLRPPTLLLVGALDETYAARGRDMNRRMPNAELVVIPDAGHAVHLERPGAFQDTVLRFLARVLTPAAHGRREPEHEGLRGE